MKKTVLFMMLFLLGSSVAFAIERNYLQKNYPYSINRQYNPYCNHCRNRKYNYNQAKRLQRVQKIKLLNRIRNNFVSLNKFNNGSLTGYSLPISPNVYSQMGINPWDKIQYNQKPSNLTTELFSSPITTETYYRNGQIVRDNGGISNKTGVTIIYD